MLPVRLVIVLVLTSLSADVIAQELPVLKARARVRVWGEGLADEGLVGQLFTVDGDTLRLFADSARPRAFALQSLRRFEVSRGRNPWVTWGVPALSAVSGAVILPLLTTEEFLCREEIAEERECAKETSDAIVGAGAGFIISSLLVNILSRERWVGIPLDQLAVRVEPRSRRFAVSMGVRF